jgi:hypothetical protein
LIDRGISLIVGNHDFVRNAGGIGVEADNERQPDSRAHDLGADENRCRTGSDGSESVGEYPPEGDGPGWRSTEVKG